VKSVKSLVTGDGRKGDEKKGRRGERETRRWGDFEDL